ncbi:hypothetical protein Pelo_11816 [Pelomyxa schiedti]|nr:hypothetical protein Pelo_11816 [Pelomyxa schiedti]
MSCCGSNCCTPQSAAPAAPKSSSCCASTSSCSSSASSSSCCGASASGGCCPAKKALKMSLVFILTGLVGMATSFVVSHRHEHMFPDLHSEMFNTNIFRPMTDSRMAYMCIHPFVTAIISMLLTRKVSKQPLHATMFWALLNLPGMLMTYCCFNLSGKLVASWFISGIILIFAQTGTISLLRSLLCGGNCGGSCGSAPEHPKKN